jgi:copper(I)-binding protein
MALDRDHMTMRPVAGLDLPAGKTVALQPGGYHLMLIGLKRHLQVGESIDLTLVVDRGGTRENVPVSAQVRALHYSPHKH